MTSKDISDFIIMAPTAMSAALNPEFELDEIATASETNAAAVHESFEALVHDLENPR